MKANDTGAQIVDKRKLWEARVEMAIFKRPQNELSTYDKLVYAILCGHANRDGNAMLYVRTIADEASCSERQVQRALATLEARHLLVRRPQKAAGQGQTFNTYEVYGFDEYSFNDTPATDSHPSPRQAVTPPVTDRQAPGDSQSGPNNVFKQLLNNSTKNNNPPLTPRREMEGGGPPETITQNPKAKEHDTEDNGSKIEIPVSRTPKEPESCSPQAILEAYNAILPELPKAENVTTDRAKVLGQRIRDDPGRCDLEWWKSYFRRVREFPWPMGDNPNGWRADFDWLTGESGMQKIIEGSFRRSSGSGKRGRTEAGAELQKKYTNERGIVDAGALLWG